MIIVATSGINRPAIYCVRRAHGARCCASTRRTRWSPTRSRSNHRKADITPAPARAMLDFAVQGDEVESHARSATPDFAVLRASTASPTTTPGTSPASPPCSGSRHRIAQRSARCGPTTSST
jgi:hypothetical protein